MISILLVFSMLLDAHVHGVVRDSSTRQPLHGATVRVVGSTRGALTDRLGMFHLHDLEQDSVTLDVTYVGYTRERVRVGVSASDDVRIEVLALPRNNEGRSW
ncbi:MAG: carboxypeptidase-like regulatory domain-containing protein [Ignavibacteria bacterium]|nr:carboxypeptidase-like regulatory domain-containing protein [Ignavibacteria bacterium]